MTETVKQTAFENQEAILAEGQLGKI